MRRPNAARRATIALLLFFVVAAVAAIVFQIYDRRKKEMAVQQFYTFIGAGWNLGNSLEVHRLHKENSDPAYYETYWNNPVTTPEILAQVKAAGFQTIRIPVTWYVHMDADCNIDDAWMRRVKEVVDDALAAGLNVIINAHHENWYDPEESNLEQASAITQKLWRQISAYFSLYDERLLFEGMNEPRLTGTENEWTAGTSEARRVVNALNLVFVQTVRESGGNNAKRYLLIPTYCAGVKDAALEDIAVPDGENIAVSVHLYAPYHFANEAGKQTQWDADESGDTKELDHIFKKLNALFVHQGIPVIITEFGAADKDNTESREAWTAYVVRNAADIHIPCVWWDAGGDGEKARHRLLDRYTLTWVYPGIVRCIIDSTK